MLIPWNTDAPLYHRPFATVGLILANVVAFIVSMSDPKTASEYCLSYGEGLHPIQWVTSNFLHADPVHLVGNMIFLWSFGLVVEGKTGWLGFLAVYLGVGVAECALEQSATMGFAGGSLGASSVIFGLLAICVVWAPRNDFHCVWFIGLRPHMVDVPILVFGAMDIGFEAVFAWWHGLSPSSAMLHLAGAFLGFVVGVALLKLDWVDCEGWDLFAVIAGNEGRRTKTVRMEGPTEPEIDLDEIKVRFRRAVADKDGRTALLVYSQLAKAKRKWKLTEQELLAFLKALHAHSLWTDSTPFAIEFLRRFPDNTACTRLRLRLAQILIEQQRPAQALKVLAPLDDVDLTPELAGYRRKMIRAAQKLQEDGVMELETEDW